MAAAGRWADALDELRLAVAVNPFNKDWHVSIGRALDELGRPEEAAAAYRHALSLVPDDVMTLNALGVTLHQSGRHAEALSAFERVETLEPSFEPSYCNRVAVYAETGQHQQAEEMFYLARLYKEHCPQCYFNMGISLAARGLEAKAVYCWQRTLDLAGEDVHVRQKLAEAAWARGSHETARRHYLAGLSASPNHLPALLDLGRLLTDMHRLDEAGRKIAQAALIAPASAAVSFARAKLFAARGRWADASVEVRQALSFDPTLPCGHLLLARVALAQQQPDTAREELRAELQLRPDTPSVLLELADLLLDAKEIRPAVACLRRLTQLQPASRRAWQNLAVAECLRGRLSRGIDAAIRALELDPTHGVTRHNLVLAYIESGRLDAARIELKIARTASPADSSLGRLHFRLCLARGVAWLGRLAGLKRQRAA